MENEKNVNSQVKKAPILSLNEWNSYFTMLQSSVLRDKTIENLKTKGCLNARDSKAGHSFLFAACTNNLGSLAKRLIEEGAEVNVIFSDAKQTTPLLQTIKNDYLELGEVLLQHGADINFPRNLTPLNAAIRTIENPEKLLRVVTWLLQKGADHTVCASIDGFNPLTALISYHPIKNIFSIAQKLLEKYSDLSKELSVDENKKFFFYFIAKNSGEENPQAIKKFYELLESKSFFSGNNRILLLLIALDKENIFHLEQLLLKGEIALQCKLYDGSQNEIEKTFVQYALYQKKKESVIEVLIKKSSLQVLNDFGTMPYNSLHLTIIKGYSVKLISKLIEKRVNIFAITAETSREFKTRIHKKNLSTEILNMHGNTALHLAFVRTDFDERLSIIQKLLFSFGDYIMEPNKEGFTILHFACILGDEKLIELLISDAKKKEQFMVGKDIVNIFGESAISILESNKGNFSKEKVKRMLELFHSEEPQKNPEPNFAHQLNNLSSGNIAESGRAYAMKIMTPEEYEQHRLEVEANKDAHRSDNNNNNKEEILSKDTSWLGKRISLSDVKEIERKGSPYCFSYIYLPSIAECSLNEQEKFIQLSGQFAGLKGSIGLKDVKGGYKTKIQYGDAVVEVEISYKIKISDAARLYMVKIPADDKGRGTLFLGLFYTAANKHDRKNLLAEQKNKIHHLKL